MKNNKSPGPDGIPIEFYKAIFCNSEEDSNITNAHQCFEIIFYFSMTSIPKVSCYTYLGIPFSEDLSLQPILSNMYNKVNRFLNSFKSFLTNNTIPLPFKKMVLQSFIISKVLYYAPLLGSN